MNSPESLRKLLQKYNAIKNAEDLTALNGSAFFEAATKELAEVAVDENQASTSSTSASSSSSSSTSMPNINNINPFQHVVDRMKKQEKQYEKILKSWNTIAAESVKSNILASPAPPAPLTPKEEAPLAPEIAEMLKIYQRLSKNALESFETRITLKDDGNFIRRLFNSQLQHRESSKKDLELLNNNISLVPFVNYWVAQSRAIDCKVYSSNEAGEMQVLSCHQAVFKQHSMKLKCDIKSEAFLSDDKNIMHIPLFEFPAAVVESFLVGCYDGPLSNFQGVFLMAKQLRAISLMNSAIQGMKSTLTIAGVVKQYQFAYTNDLFDLLEKCVDYIKAELQYIKFSEAFENFSESVLHEFAVNVGIDNC